jgi:hypothetical protein
MELALNDKRAHLCTSHSKIRKKQLHVQKKKVGFSFIAIFQLTKATVKQVSSLE